MKIMEYVIFGLCVLLVIAGMVWYIRMTRSSEDEKSNETDPSQNKGGQA